MPSVFLCTTRATRENEELRTCRTEALCAYTSGSPRSAFQRTGPVPTRENADLHEAQFSQWLRPGWPSPV